MSLYLYELAPTAPSREQAELTIKRLDAAAVDAGGALIETQVTADHGRVFAITEFADCQAPDFTAAALEVDTVEGPSQVRLVGAEIDQVKAARPDAGYLVEWDIPAEIDMDTYLSRKAEKSPLYADVPEVAFLRTYVREDMAKCLCFYDAPDEQAVRHARDVVSTPVDRLHKLG